MYTFTPVILSGSLTLFLPIADESPETSVLFLLLDVFGKGKEGNERCDIP